VPQSGTHQINMKRTFKYFIGFIVIIVIFLAIAAFYIPELLTFYVKQQFLHSGFANAKFTLASIDSRHASIKNIYLRQKMRKGAAIDIKIPQIKFVYSLDSLLMGQAQKIVVENPVVKVQLPFVHSNNSSTMNLAFFKNLPFQQLKINAAVFLLNPLSREQDQLKLKGNITAENKAGKINIVMQKISGKAGIIALKDFKARWQVEPLSNKQFGFLINFVDGRLLGGSLHAKDIHFKSSDADYKFNVLVKNVDVPQLMGLLEQDKVLITGRLSGTLPIVINKDRFNIDNGLLTTQGTGVVEYRRSSDAQSIENTNPDLKWVLDALSNFDYKKIKLRINCKAQGKSVIMLTMLGSNAEFYDNYPVEYNIKLTGPFIRILRDYSYSDEEFIEEFLN
jgi:hypothetical protein